VTDYIAEAVKYFGKKKIGRDPMVEKMEKAAGIESVPLVPDTGVTIHRKGFIRKMKKIQPKIFPEKKLMEKSTGGSPPFTGAEMKKGYRKV